MIHVATGLLLALLVLFSARRLLWVVAAWLRPRAATPRVEAPHVLIAIAFRNERDCLPALLRSLDALHYDAGRRSICLVDDASTDAGGEIGAAWARDRANVRLIVADRHLGKASALNRALATASADAEVLVVYDADQRPHPDSLHRLVAPFADPRIEATTGYRKPVIARAGAVASYGCLEAWTQQLVTLAAKDALRLDPPTMGGNCAYRRCSLERIGGFRAGAISEDIEASLALAVRRGSTRFVRDAIAEHAVADSFRHFCNQRLRWSRGLVAARRHVRAVEAAFVAVGYLDRIVLLLVVLAVVAGHASAGWLGVYAVPAAAAVVTAIVKARPAPRLACAVLAWFPLMFAADVAISVAAAWHGIARRRTRWLDRRAAGSSTVA